MEKCFATFWVELRDRLFFSTFFLHLKFAIPRKSKHASLLRKSVDMSQSNRNRAFRGIKRGQLGIFFG